MSRWRLDPWSASWSLRSGTRGRCLELVDGGFRGWVGPAADGLWAWTLQVVAPGGVPSFRWPEVRRVDGCRTRAQAKRDAEAALDAAKAWARKQSERVVA